MDYDNKDDKITVQGGETPVPVRGLSGRAGSPGPSASDRSAPLVDGQAGEGSSATGNVDVSGSNRTEGKEDVSPFFRKPLLQRTPPMRSRTRSLPEMVDEEGGGPPLQKGAVTDKRKRYEDEECVILDGELDKQRSPVRGKERYQKTPDTQVIRPVKKRKERDTLPGRGGVDTKHSALLKEMKDQIEELGLFGKKNSNVHREVKRMALELSSKVNRYMRELTKDKESGSEQEEEVGKSESETQTSPMKDTVVDIMGDGGATGDGMRAVNELLDKLADAEAEVRSLRKVNEELVMKMENDQIRKLQEENLELRKQVQELIASNDNAVSEGMLDGVGSFEEFRKMEGMVWPDNIFKVAFLAAGSPVAGRKETDHLVIYEEGIHQKVNEGIIKVYEDRFPELCELEGSISAIKVVTNLVTRMGDVAAGEKWIIRGEVGDGMEDWFGVLKEVKEMMVNGNRKKLAVYPPGTDARGLVTRKMLEYIFRGSGINCLLHRKVSASENQGSEESKERRIRRNDALVVSQSGRSYADLLKVVREKVSPESTAAKAIRTIRESRDGRMVIVLNKDGGSATEHLMSELNQLEAVEIRMNGEKKDEMVFIHDIDSLTSKEDVLEMVCKETGLNQEAISMGELRDSYGGNKAVSVRLPREKAEELNRKQSLRIGLNMCPVKERVNVTRCYRCWGYGHIGRECREEEDSSKLCKKCGGSGHMAVTCTRQDWCLTCKIGGHTTGSGACPEFRKAIARGRKTSRKKRMY